MRLAATAAGLFVTAFLGAGPALAGTERAQILCELDETGAEDGAAGKASLKLAGARSKLDLRLSGLEPEAEYEVEVEGIPEASFVTRRSGKANVGFRTRPRRSQAALDFDPRGKTLTVSSAGEDVLVVELASGALESGETSYERALIPATALAPDAKIVATDRVRRDGRRDFDIEAQRLPAGSYDVYIGGILRGVLVTSGARGRGELEFRDPLGDDDDELLLDFDPSGQEIVIAVGGAIFGSGPFLASIAGVSECTEASTQVVLTAQPGAPAGSAKAKLSTNAKCRREFEVEVEDVPIGAYELRVGGLARATITVVAVQGGTRGEIEFETQGSDDDPSTHELPLDFDPSDAQIELVQGMAVLFSGNLANGAPSGPPICNEPASEVQVSLLNTGADADAKGKARHRLRDDCEQDFRVEVENLTAGGYDLYVGGVYRGTIQVALVAGELEGEIEFDTDPDEPGEVLLDFDPRGLGVEIRRNGTIYLSRLFPAAD